VAPSNQHTRFRAAPEDIYGSLKHDSDSNGVIQMQTQATTLHPPDSSSDAANKSLEELATFTAARDQRTYKYIGNAICCRCNQLDTLSHYLQASLEVLHSPAPQRRPIRRKSAFNIQSIRVFRRVQIRPPARIQIDLMNALEVRAPDPLVHEENDGEQWQQDVCVNETASVERRESSPALHKSQENVRANAEIRIPWVEHRFERQFADWTSLVIPGLAEADMDERDGGPDEESADSTEVDDVLVRRRATGGVVHH
jgi:hypothetical protein